ncbi:MAG: class I SAM-dependent methyltransferase [Bacteroidales bacterium]
MQHGKASKTAELSAMIRTLATKNKYGKLVFDDPYSKFFIGSKTRFIYIFNRIWSFVNPAFWNKGMNSVGYLLSLCRHRYIYNILLNELKTDNLQVLIIGAGYDTNYLLVQNKIKNQRFFELDFPATQQRKKNIIQKHVKDLPYLNFCEIDLKQKSIHQALKDSNFDNNRPTLIIIEGVLSYLTKPEIESLLLELSRLSSQVKIIADYRKPELNQQNNSTAKQWITSFSNYNEKYVSFYNEPEITELLNKSNLKILENKDLIDLWIQIDEVKPNDQLSNFGGIFLATNEKH